MARPTHPVWFLFFGGSDVVAVSFGVKLRAAEKQKTKMRRGVADNYKQATPPGFAHVADQSNLSDLAKDMGNDKR
jgi:hypothetical protein